MKTKIELYFMSLGLLFGLLLIKAINIPICFDDDAKFIGCCNLIKMNIPTLVCFFCLIAEYFCVKRFLHSLGGSKDLPCTIKKIKNGNFEYLTFLTTYIIPLVCFDLGKPHECILLVVLLILLGIIFIRTNLYYTNPALCILGFNLYEAEIEYKSIRLSNLKILSKIKLKENDKFKKIDLVFNEVIYCKELNAHG